MLCHPMVKFVMLKWYGFLHYKENPAIYWMTLIIKRCYHVNSAKYVVLTRYHHVNSTCYVEYSIQDDIMLIQLVMLNLHDGIM